MNIIQRLEGDAWETIPVEQVCTELAKKIRTRKILTKKPPVQLISRIQVLLVNAGVETDNSFMEKLLREE